MVHGLSEMTKKVMDTAERGYEALLETVAGDQYVIQLETLTPELRPPVAIDTGIIRSRHWCADIL